MPLERNRELEWHLRKAVIFLPIVHPSMLVDFAIIALQYCAYSYQIPIFFGDTRSGEVDSM